MIRLQRALATALCATVALWSLLVDAPVLASTVTSASVSVGTPAAGRASGYTVAFATTTPLTGGADTVSVTFPGGTGVPDTLAAADITVAVNAGAATVTVAFLNNGAGHALTNPTVSGT